MPVAMNETQRKRSQARAKEWKEFRRAHLYTQSALADQLRCSRRTVVAIERCELVSPRFSLLIKFRELKAREEKAVA